MPTSARARLFSSSVVTLAGATLASILVATSGCSKPEQLTGTFSATCAFKGSYRGGGRADNPWTRQCAVTLESKNETEIAMRFDSGDAIECYGHGVQTGSNGERKISFAKNDLTCRARTLPAPPGVRVEQCPMPATFELTEVVEKGKKPAIAVKVAVDVADKRACVFSYYEKVAIDAKLAPGGKPAVIEIFKEVDAGPIAPLPSREAPMDLSLPVTLDAAAPSHDAGAGHDAGASHDAGAKGAPPKDASAK